MPHITGVRAEWIRFEGQVLRMRRSDNPELRAAELEAFVGGAGAMLRIFCEEVSKLPTPMRQQKAIQEIHEELRVLAIEAGRK